MKNINMKMESVLIKLFYAYKLASQEQGEQITVKTPNKVELDYLQECELVEPDVKMYVSNVRRFWNYRI
ncbi:transposon-related protein [Staphylococcus aureus]|uniref:Transposon-related protein n=1 Tax=Staphylococcus aureus TaxID=1280 RepID=A0A2X2M4S4_STAAU|nr:transposon-related protein [Staphylococcus aureus]